MRLVACVLFVVAAVLALIAAAGVGELLDPVTSHVVAFVGLAFLAAAGADLPARLRRE